MVSVHVIFAIVVILAAVIFNIDAAYRKPPFNGSIFGKRSSIMTDYEVTGRALNTMCEIASETCNAWFSHQESN